MNTKIKFTETEPEHLKSRNLKLGQIEFTDAGTIANTYRRVLLDEIEITALNTDFATLKTNDGLISHEVMRIISFIRLLDPLCSQNLQTESDLSEKNENDYSEYYIKISVKGDQHYNVLSDHIYDAKTHKPAPVEQGVHICTLSPNCYFEVLGIQTSTGTGRENARFSAIVGTVTYEPTDIFFVHYLNNRGFIEDNMKALCRKWKFEDPVLKKYAETAKLNTAPKNAPIIWNKEWANYMSKSDQAYSEEMIKVSYEGPYFVSEKHYSNDYIITFKSENPAKTFQAATATILKELNHYKSELTENNPSTTISIGELINHFCQLEIEKPVFANYSENSYKITIAHENQKKIQTNVIDNLIKVFKYAL